MAKESVKPRLPEDLAALGENFAGRAEEMLVISPRRPGYFTSSGEAPFCSRQGNYLNIGAIFPKARVAYCLLRSMALFPPLTAPSQRRLRREDNLLAISR